MVKLRSGTPVREWSASALMAFVSGIELIRPVGSVFKSFVFGVKLGGLLGCLMRRVATPRYSEYEPAR